MTAALNRRSLRFSADVGCAAVGEGSGPLASNCRRLAASGVNRLMTMETYNANEYTEWYEILRDAVQEVPLDVLGVGLGCWIGGGVHNGSWSTTAQSAAGREKFRGAWGVQRTPCLSS